MRIGFLGKCIGTGLLISVLSACGGSSGSGTPFTQPQSGPMINALAVDGPILDAIVEVYALQDYLTNGAGASSLLAAPRRSNAATGLIDDLELVANPGVGPFVLVATADATTTDLTTGTAPVLGSVITVITAAEYALTPQPRFYATPLTTLAVRQAIQNAASASETDVLAGLSAAQTTIKTMFGFGITSNIDLFTTPAVIDPSTTSIALQTRVAEYRAAIQTLVNVIVAAGGNANAVVDALLLDIADGVLDDAANLALFNAVNDTGNYAIPNDILTLLGGETTTLGLGVDLDTGVTLPPGFPSVPDSDQDGLTNDNDAAPQNNDADGDQVLDGADNCPAAANAGQEDLDGDGAGNACDADADADGVNGDGTGNPGADVNDLDNTIATDADADGVDDVGGGSFNPTFAGAADNCPVANPGQEDLDGDGAGNVCDADADADGVNGDGAGGPDIPNGDRNDLDDTVGIDADDDGVNDTAGGNFGTPDNCPAVANPGQEDLDGDGAGNVCDADADGDGVNGDGAGGPGADVNDLDNTIATDGDNDGVDDVGGGTFGTADNCPAAANPGQEDLDSDGAGNVCDADADGDTVNGDGAGGPGADVNDLDNTIATDADSDGVDDVGGGTFNPTFAGAADNCPVANPDQLDLDADGAGNACDADADGDGVNGDGAGNPGTDINDLDNTIATDADSDGVDDVGGGTFNPTFAGAPDNCPVANSDQLDLDIDGLGNACDNDADGDGADGDGSGGPSAFDSNDLDANVIQDTDGDGVDDNAVGTGPDNCPAVANPGQQDLDGDGAGNACDADADADGVNGDGMGGPGADVNDLDNTIATDADNDGVDDVGGGTFNPTFAGAADNCPATPNADQLNTATPNFALGDACDPDDDGVGSAPEAGADNCPSIANAAQLDLDADSEGDACDADIDGDLIPNELDPDPLSSAGNYHSDSLFSALFAAGDQSAFGLFSGYASTVRVENSAPIDAVKNVLQLGSDQLGDGTFAFNRQVEEVIADLTLGGSCGPGVDCTTTSTPTITTDGPTLYQDAGTDTAFYTPPTGASNGSLTVDYAEVSIFAQFDGGSDAILEIELDLDYVNGGTAYAAFGQSFIGTQRISVDLYPVTSEDACATDLGLDPFSDEPSLDAAVNAFVLANTDPAGAAAAVFSAAANCPSSGGFLLNTLDVFSPEPVGLTTSDFDGLNFGLVEFSSAYTTATTTNLMVLNSRVSNLAITGATAAITTANTAAVTSSIGTTDAQLAYNTTDADITFITADAAGEGGIELTRDGGNIVTGFAANDLELLTFGGYTPATASNAAVIDRGYAVQLGSGVVAADLDGASYDLQGIVVETANTGIEMRTFKGAAVAFSVSGAEITATLSGDVEGLGGEFDDASNVLPPLLASSASLAGLVSNTFSITTDGRIAPITFPASGLELEGFYTANGGLVLRLVDTLSTTGGGGGGGAPQFYCGSPAGQNFVDPNTLDPIVPQPTGSFVCGFVLAGGGGGTSTPFTSDARATPQTFSAIAAGDEVLVKQGVLFGTVNEPAL